MTRASGMNPRFWYSVAASADGLGAVAGEGAVSDGEGAAGGVDGDGVGHGREVAEALRGGRDVHREVAGGQVHRGDGRPGELFDGG